MKKIYCYLSILPLLVWSVNLQAQCSLNTFSTNQTITCGNCTTLSAYGFGAGGIAFQETFNSGSPVGWQFTQAVTIANNTCGVASPDGSAFMWMGAASTNPRDMTTVPFNLTQGGTVCFEMRYSIQGGTSPCEGPDEPQEGVYIQYSTNGTTWTTIQYWDPNGGASSSPLTQWNQYCVNLPPGALTTTTQIRWHQDNVSAAVNDHWGIDNVIIRLNDPNYQITWLHDNFQYPMGSSGGDNTTQVCPTATTTYNAQITDGTNTCNSSITVNVVPPTLIVNAGNDTTICAGDCATLHAVAYEQISPASTPTFSNAQIGVITGTPGVPFLGTNGTINADMNINVQNLNATTVTAGSITGVCVRGLSVTPGLLCTGTSLANVSLVLVCPSGTQITLVPIGGLSGNTITNMCFALGAPSYTTSSSPYTGTFAPANSWAGLNGCTSNGVWTLKVVGVNPQTCIPIGSLAGWSISFDDPELTEPVNYTWSPTTNMTNSTTLSPTVCPTTSTTYTLTAADTDGCTSSTDQVIVNIGPCCDLEIDNIATVNPGCGTPNGQITVQYSGEITGLQFSIDGGLTFQSSNIFNNLAAGTYQVQIKDDSNCPDNEQVVLTSATPPTLTSSSTPPACGGSDGTITVVPTGGTSPYQYNINGGTNQTSATFTGLPAGTHNIIVIDNNGCQDTESVTLVAGAGPVISSLTPTNPACGGSDGTITVVLTGGTSPYQYNINGGTNQTSATFTGLPAGTHNIIVIDNNGCQDTESITLVEGAGPVISSVTPTSPTCGASNGSLVINATGGTSPYEYSVNNGTTNQTANSFSNLSSATYQVVVTDANGCDATQSVQLTTPNAPVIDDITLVHPPCGTTNGSLTVVASGGIGTLSYSINGGPIQSSAVFSNLPAGSYDVTVTDANACEFDETVVLVQGTGPVISVVTPANPGCNATNGSISITATGGTAPLTYSINGGTTNQATGSFAGLGDGTYNIVVEDATGCEAIQTATLTDGPGPSITTITPTAPNCGASDGAINIVATGGTSLTYSINGGTTTQPTGTFNNLPAGTYNVVVEDVNGCEITQTVSLNTSSVPNVNAGADITICLGESVTLTATGATTYTWTEGVNNGVPFTPTLTNTYTVTGTDAAGCVNTDAVTVTVIPIPTAGFTASVTSGDPVLDVVFTNTSSGATGYSWNFGDGSTPVVTGSNASQDASYSEPGIYTVVLTAANGNCTNTFSLPITVIGFPFDIHVPNVFTPNGDKSNDEFFIEVTNGKSIEVNIFNRWGNKMFDITDFKTKWDGKDAADGVYFFTYTITGLNGEVREGQGHVTLIKK